MSMPAEYLHGSVPNAVTKKVLGVYDFALIRVLSDIVMFTDFTSARHGMLENRKRWYHSRTTTPSSPSDDLGTPSSLREHQTNATQELSSKLRCSAPSR